MHVKSMEKEHSSWLLRSTVMMSKQDENGVVSGFFFAGTKIRRWRREVRRNVCASLLMSVALGTECHSGTNLFRDTEL